MPPKSEKDVICEPLRAAVITAMEKPLAAHWDGNEKPGKSFWPAKARPRQQRPSSKDRADQMPEA